MNVDQQTRNQLRALTEDVVGGPDLDRVLTDGRRARRARQRRTAVSSVAALAVAGVVAGAAYQHARGPAAHQAVDQTADSPASYHDFVAGSDVDETIQTAVAGDLPGISAATRLYASDWNHDGPLADSQAQNATDWEAFYDASPTDMLAISLSKKIPGGVALDECSDIPSTVGQPACDISTLGDGSTLVEDSYTLTRDGQPEYWFTTALVRPDGSVVTANQRVTADAWPQAISRRTYSPSQTSALVQDPTLTFPDPVVTPPPPADPR